MKKIKLIILILFTGGFVLGQDISVEWIKQAGGINFDVVTDFQTDNDNNLFVTGVFSEQAIFENKKISSQGKQNIFIAKYNKKGELQWLQQYGSQESVTSHSLSISNKGEIFICGTFKKELTFGNETIKSSGFSNNYLAKLDKNGNPLWIKLIKSDSKGKKTFVVSDKNNNLYYAGTFYNRINFGKKNLKAVSSSDIFLAKYSNKGVFINAISISGFNGEELNDLKCNNEGNIYLTGSFTDEIKFSGAIMTSAGKEDVFIAKFNELKFEWAKKAGGYYKDYGKEIFIKNNNIYLTGSYSGTANFDNKEITSTGVSDAFVSCYNKNGKLLWLNSFGSSGNDYASSINVNNNNTVYITGTYRGTFAKDNNIKSKGFTNDIFTAKFTKKGKYISAISFGGNKHDFASKLFTDADNFIYQTGKFDNSLEIIKDKKAKGKKDDIFIVKYYDCQSAEKINLGDDITVYANSYTIKPKGNYTTYKWNNGTNKKDLKVTESGEYILKVTDENNCISQDTINIELYETLYDETKDATDNTNNKNKNGTAGINDIKLQLSLSIFPNPAKNDFYVNIKNINTNEKLYIKIVDENGKLIYQENIANKSQFLTQKLKLNNISAGVFYVVVINGNKKVGERVVFYK